MVRVIDYVEGDTLLHRLNPVAKLALAAGIIVATFLARTWAVLVALLVLTLALGAYAHVSDRLRSILKVLLPVAAVMLALQCAFVTGGDHVLLWMTTDGLTSGGKACLRLLGVALPLILVLTVTRLNDLANACVEVLHVPYRYAFTFTTALRFVPVFGQEMNAIMEAQTARGVEYDTKNPFRKLRLMLPLCIPLLVSSVGKTDATALAAEQRGFYLRTRESSYRRYPLKAADWACVVLACALVVLGAAL
ncbi:MAG: energy-coupling factor transporter transmembrane component T [Olsenella sp.]|nr:energy-coupling factor transporter transmembrane component T [Olsenella sp.]